MSTTPHQLIQSLLTSLPKPTTPSANPLHNAPPETKPILLTLYALFEPHFLPALDLLDRNLVTRLIIPEDSNNNNTNPQNPTPTTIYYLVRSATPNTTTTTHHHHHHHQIHLESWNCTCPAFTFAAFPPRASTTTTTTSTTSTTSSSSNDTTTTTAAAPSSPQPPPPIEIRGQLRDAPVCKHLLACVLVARTAMFSHLVREREGNVEEVAGWAAGWGG